MFSNRYFADRYFAPRYFGPEVPVAGEVIVSPTPIPVGVGIAFPQTKPKPRNYLYFGNVTVLVFKKSRYWKTSPKLPLLSFPKPVIIEKPKPVQKKSRSFTYQADVILSAKSESIAKISKSKTFGGNLSLEIISESDYGFMREDTENDDLEVLGLNLGILEETL